MVPHSLITSCLDYYNILYMGRPLKNMKLQLSRIKWGFFFWPLAIVLLHEFHWLSGFQVHFKVLIVTYISPVWHRARLLQDHLSSIVSACHIRSSRWGMFWVPSIKQCYIVRRRTHAFCAAVLALWNSSPLREPIAPTFRVFF